MGKSGLQKNIEHGVEKMDFIEAIKALKEGKKITMPYWNGDYLFLPKDGEIVLNSEKKAYSFNFVSIESNKWEVVEEEDNWNIESVKLDSFQSYKMPPYCFYGDVVKLKEKILEDIENTTYDFREQGLDKSQGDRIGICKEIVETIINKRFGF